jgi:hypothetical protein
MKVILAMKEKFCTKCFWYEKWFAWFKSSP